MTLLDKAIQENKFIKEMSITQFPHPLPYHPHVCIDSWAEVIKALDQNTSVLIIKHRSGPQRRYGVTERGTTLSSISLALNGSITKAIFDGLKRNSSLKMSVSVHGITLSQ